MRRRNKSQGNLRWGLSKNWNEPSSSYDIRRITHTLTSWMDRVDEREKSNVKTYPESLAHVYWPCAWDGAHTLLHVQEQSNPNSTHLNRLGINFSGERKIWTQSGKGDHRLTEQVCEQIWKIFLSTKRMTIWRPMYGGEERMYTHCVWIPANLMTNTTLELCWRYRKQTCTHTHTPSKRARVKIKGQFRQNDHKRSKSDRQIRWNEMQTIELKDLIDNNSSVGEKQKRWIVFHTNGLQSYKSIDSMPLSHVFKHWW